MNFDERILKLIDLLRFEKKIKSEADFCRKIEMLPQRLTKIRNKKQYFTAVNIQKICEEFNVNANWIFGIQDKVYNENNSIEIKDV